MYLLDTNVISELRKSNKADTNVLRWAKNIYSREMFISVVTIMELKLGILAVGRKDVGQADVLSKWFSNQVLPAFSNRILSIDMKVALQCAGLHVPDPKSDRDALIAATALVYGCTVVTRNINDFKQTGVLLLNPWEWIE